MDLIRQYKIFKMMSKIKKVNKSLWIFNYLLPLLHLFCIIFLMLLNIQEQISVPFNAVSQVMANIKSNYLTIRMANLYFVVGIIIDVMLIFLSVLRLNIVSNYDEVSKNKKA